MKAREAWYEKSEAVPYLGIVASEQTRTLYARGALPVYFSYTLGAFKSYLEKHVPVRVLTEHDLEAADLQGVRVLVLPNVACLSDRAAEVVRRFVKAGGGLVATFETSLYDADYKKRDDFALADLFRARYVGTNAVTQRVEQLSLTLDSDHAVVNDPVIKSRQQTAWLKPRQPAREGPARPHRQCHRGQAARRRDGARDLQCRRPAGEGRVRHPAVIASEYGKGRVVYFPASVDKGMFFYPDAYMRQMLSPRGEVGGPRRCAAVRGRRGR